MKTQIMENLDNPAALEAMYRGHKTNFTEAMDGLYETTPNQPILQFWYTRLHYKKENLYFSDKHLIWASLYIAILAMFLVKIPYIYGIDYEYFYTRNIGFVVFFPLGLFFAWKNQIPKGALFILLSLFFATCIYLNFLPDNPQSNTLALACMHVVIMLWMSLSYVYGDSHLTKAEKRMAFLKFTGDLIVLGVIICLAAAILSGITIGLFEVIGFPIESFYFEHIVPLGLPLIPLLATYLIQVNPQLVDKISPLIAKIFSPLVLVMLLVYLAAMVFSNKNLYTDRDLLLIFNILLIGVMAIIFFALSESYKQRTSNFQLGILIALSIVTLVVNSFALSAIVYRVMEFGFTPNRVAVLGSNLLMLLNLGGLCGRMLQGRKHAEKQGEIAELVVKFIPLYLIWTAIVVFVLPILFKYL